MDGGGTSRDAADPELTIDLLADLQAGLLDDASAARIRQRIRDDPDAANRLAALDRVRRDLRFLGTDAASAAPAPEPVIERVRAALRTVPRRRGTAWRRLRTRGRKTTPRHVIALTGATAALVAVGLGSAALLRGPDHPPVSAAGGGPVEFPLTGPQLLDLLHRTPDYGPLADARRRASCLAGLGYPASTIPLGATSLSTRGDTVEVLLLPGSAGRTVRAVAVRPSCSSADTGLLRETTFDHP